MDVPEFETGAKQWPLVFGRLRFGLMTLKQAYICAAMLIPLAGFVWYLTGSISMKFRTIFNASSLTSASEKDKQVNKVINKSEQNGIRQFGEIKNLNNAYLPPIMCIEYNLQHGRRISRSGSRLGVGGANVSVNIS